MKHFLLYFLLSVSFVYVYGQTTKTVKVSYSPDDFCIETHDDMTCITSAKYTLLYNSGLVAPPLPYINLYIIIGSHQEYVSHNVNNKELLIQNDVNLQLHPDEIPTNKNRPFFNHSVVYYPMKSYPSSFVEYCGSYLLGGYKILGFSIYPFKYDTHKTLYLNTDIEITINLQSNNNKSITPVNDNIKKQVEHLIYNKTDLNELYNEPMTNSDYEYIVVTVDSLKTIFKKLVDWKKQKGIKSKLLTIEEINNGYEGRNIQLKIKKALKDYYNGTYSGLKYVLLGGDVDLVPAQKCYIENGSLYKDTIAADLFYSCFTTMDWDSNGNNIYGEVLDSVNLWPSVAISRLSVSNYQDAMNQVNRIIEYECFPDTINWKDNILLAGAALTNGNYYINGNLVSDAHYWGHKLYTSYIHPYWNGEKTFLFDTGSDFNGGADYDFTPEHLQIELGKGYTFVNIDTHGSDSAYNTEYGDDYLSAYASTLHNVGYTLITTTACTTNSFDKDSLTCISEYFMRNPNSGVVFYLGSVREGWVYTSFYFNQQFYKALLTTYKQHIGDAVNAMKNYYINNYNKYNAYRWLAFAINSLGDPEMGVWLARPKPFNNIYINKNNNTISVATGVDNCTISIVSNSSIDEYYQVVKDVSSINLTDPATDYTICITKQGYIPYFIHVSDTLFLQNETITGDHTYIANNVFIGNDVTNANVHGPVTVRKGRVKIHSDNVVLKNNIDIMSGAKFEIQ